MNRKSNAEILWDVQLAWNKRKHECQSNRSGDRNERLSKRVTHQQLLPLP